jgi:hypothetical protein
MIRKMEINEPIFIIGNNRSGTNILYKLFTEHQDTAYFENYSSRYYKRPNMFKFIPLLKKYQKFRYGIDRPKRSEGWVWDRFYTLLEYLDESHVTEEIKNYYYNAIKYQLKAFNASRFVSSNPRSSMRVKWLNQMFPDAFYIVISRDKKSVISSMYQVITQKRKKWGDKFLEPPSTLRGYGHVKKILDENSSDMQTCIDFYELYQKTLKKDLPLISDRTIHVTYEDFVKDSKNTIKKLYKFTHLEWYEKLEKLIPEHIDLNRNDRWKLLPEVEKKVLLEYMKKI